MEALGSLMPAVLIDVRSADDSRDVVHQAVQYLAEGKLVAFPTETVYGIAASGLDEQAVGRLAAAKGRAEEHPLPLAIRSRDEARDYVPDLSPLAQRLARRCWPGPITLVVDDSHPESLVKRSPPQYARPYRPSRPWVCACRATRSCSTCSRMLAGPLVLSSANRTGQPAALDAQQVLEALGDDLDLILDDGPCRFGQPSSVVRVKGNHYDVLRVGVVPEMTLKRLASLMLLFVCTGNTCRSPMAEALARCLLAKRLGCTPDTLEDHGVIVASAGVSATMGGRASPEAVQVLADMGLNLTDHETQPLTEPLIRKADVIFAMSRSHREAILAHWPAAAERTRLLAHDAADVVDPIGGPLERYRRCAAEIENELQYQLNQLEL